MKQFSNEQLMQHLKDHGFIIPNSEIYGRVANAWDYGHVGVLLKQKLQQLWWKNFITMDFRVVGLDSNILLNPNVWVASGHVDHFSDYLIDCKHCQQRFRADHLLTDFGYQQTENQPLTKLETIINQDQKIICPSCHHRDFTAIRKFNLMFQTTTTSVDKERSFFYLRPETAQGIFVNYKHLQRINRLKLPFGIGQVGKSFRNEITVSHGIFRTREFEQMELEWFCHPNQTDFIFEEQLTKIKTFLTNLLRINPNNLQFYEVPATELAHYSTRTVDIQFRYCHGFAELWGIANRQDYDLVLHQNHSRQNLTYFDETTKNSFLPHIVEPSVGLNRLMYALITEHYYQEPVGDGTRIVLKLPYYLAPYHVAVFGLTKQQNSLTTLLTKDLINHGLDVYTDYSGSIGKRYRRADALGIKYVITCDFTTSSGFNSEQTNFPLDHLLVTVRDRDTMKQIQLPYHQLLSNLLAMSNPFINPTPSFDWGQ